MTKKINFKNDPVFDNGMTWQECHSRLKEKGEYSPPAPWERGNHPCSDATTVGEAYANRYRYEQFVKNYERETRSV